MKIIFAHIITVGASVAIALSNTEINATKSLKQQALAAVSPDVTVSAPAIAALRSAGPVGLDALFKVHAAVLNKPAAIAPLPSSVAERLRIKAALDAVGQQHDCYASHLYWFTNLDDAKAAAKSSGKPILSLRMLGKLDEEFSCANSRFFRTTLYANSEISDYLRGHFILHWKSVRPVPRITVDFGDGRKLERTITGNSIHYILDAEGRVVDALPGLYGPQAFLAGLKKAEPEALASVSVSGPDRSARLRNYHHGEEQRIATAFSADLAAVKTQKISSAKASETEKPILISAPSAQAAARLALSKGGVEKPILRAAFPARGDAVVPGTEADIDDATWSLIAALHSSDAMLDLRARELIRAKNPTAWDASRVAATKAIPENPLLRMLRNLERSIAEDTVRNEYLFHRTIHQWLADADAATEVDKLNTKVYAQLFLTPDYDPWLGLVQNDTFSALDNGGLITKTGN